MLSARTLAVDVAVRVMNVVQRVSHGFSSYSDTSQHVSKGDVRA